MGAFKRLNEFERGILSPLYICFKFGKPESHNSNFFVHYFESGILNQCVQEIAQEGARNHGLLNIAIGEFFAMHLMVPTLPEQQAIARVLDTSAREIRQQEARLGALRRQKRGLMQQLLSGVRRVTLT